MSSQDPEQSAKRRRTQEESSLCVTFEMLLEADEPIDQISERLTRLLEFEPADGLCEAVQVLLKSAGMYDHPLSSELESPEALAETLDDAFANTKWVNAASMPMNHRDYAVRVTDMWNAVVPVLAGADNGEALTTLVKYYSALATMHMRPIRQAATWLLTIIALAHEDASQLDLARIFKARAGDVVPTIRQYAVEGLDAIGEHDLVWRALNDLHASVRLEALANVADHADLVPESVWVRVAEIARRDVDVKLRRRALKTLCKIASVAKSSLDTALQCAVAADVDNDDASLAAAAELVATALIPGEKDKRFAKYKLPAQLEYTQSLLGLPPRILTSDRCVEALCTASSKLPRSRTTTKEVLRKPADVGEVLTLEFGVKWAPGDRAWGRALETTITSHRSVLIKFLAALASEARTPAELHAALVGPRGLTTVWGTLSFSDELLAQAIAVTGRFSFVNRTEALEQDISVLTQDAAVYAEQHPCTAIIEACAYVFAEAVHYPALETELQQLVITIKMNLATALGPGGRDAEDHQDEIRAAVLQSQILSRFVSVDDMARLPIWNVPACVPLIRVLAFSKSEQVRDSVVKRMMDQSPRPIQTIVESYIVARMRGESVTPDLSADELGGLADTTWRTAVAAGVF